MGDQAQQVRLQVGAGGDADAEEVADLTSQLRQELLELDVDAVELARSGPAPRGTKAVDVLAIGGLILSLAKSSALTHVVKVVQGWLSRDNRRQVEIQMDGDVLKLTGATDEEQRRLVDAWIARHAATADAG
jgi:hypothetical protein